MKWWQRRQHRAPAAPAPPRANPTRIAVLENDLLGIPPKPGTTAAAIVALRRVADCSEHVPVDTTELGDLRPQGMCTRCGKRMVEDEAGQWVIA